MNALVKKKIAKVGDEPAVTKSQQRINLSPRLTLVDTPGLMERYPALLKTRYGFDPACLDPTDVVEAVAKKRGCIMKGRGGELDLEKAANILLTDFRSGALGRISLETPGTRAAMLGNG